MILYKVFLRKTLSIMYYSTSAILDHGNKEFRGPTYMHTVCYLVGIAT